MTMSNGTTIWTNTYNPDGMRIRRTDGTNTYTYYYNGTTLKYLDYNGTKLYFSVDATGKAVEVSYGPSSTYS